MRIAHLSDIHVLDLEGTRWTRFLNKRLTGLINLRGKRRDAHPISYLEAAVAQIASDSSIDHTVITGDLSNLALDSEFARAKSILTPLDGRLSVIPGNHDIYTRGSQRHRRFQQHFGAWSSPPDAAQPWPWVRRFDQVAIFGFNSAVPRIPFNATGWVGPEQLSALPQLTQDPALQDHFKIALVHHNLHPRGFLDDRLHGLTNRDAFMDALEEAGFGLVLHGHTHQAHRFKRGRLDIIGSGSSTQKTDDLSRVARYNVYDIDASGLQHIEVRRWDGQGFSPT